VSLTQAVATAYNLESPYRLAVVMLGLTYEPRHPSAATQCAVQLKHLAEVMSSAAHLGGIFLAEQVLFVFAAHAGLAQSSVTAFDIAVLGAAVAVRLELTAAQENLHSAVTEHLAQQNDPAAQATLVQAAPDSVAALQDHAAGNGNAAD